MDGGVAELLLFVGWEQRKLGEMSDSLEYGLNVAATEFDGVHKYIRITDIDDSNHEFLQNGLTSPDTDLTVADNYKLLEGDILFARTGASVGKTYIYKESDGHVYYAGFLIRIRINNKYDAHFVFQNTLTDSYKNFVKITSQRSGQPGINAQEYRNFSINVPTKEEQIKVGIFFGKLDIAIALHQQKYDQLIQLKKAYLDLMFPKNGESVPKVRFADFQDPWEQRKLSDVANHRGGTAIEKFFDDNGPYKVISIGSYGLDSKYVDQNIRALSNDTTDGRVVHSGELTMVLNDKTANGTIIGRSLLIEQDNEYVINQRTEIVSPNENLNADFAYTVLNGPFREKVKRIVQGGTQIYVNYPAVERLILELPNIDEQKKIGAFFKNLDATIALHQRKLEKLKRLKQAYLQKMFI